MSFRHAQELQRSLMLAAQIEAQKHGILPLLFHAGCSVRSGVQFLRVCAANVLTCAQRPQLLQVFVVLLMLARALRRPR